jgi:hypothetical protein
MPEEFPKKTRSVLVSTIPIQPRCSSYIMEMSCSTIILGKDPLVSTHTKVTQIPTCNLCALNDKNVPAYADARVPLLATWAYVCKEDFDAYGCELGTGKGQAFELVDDDGENEPSQEERIRSNMADAAWEDMSFEDFEDMFEDRDPAEFL